MEIVNATHLHLEIQIFEKDAIRIVKGQKILFRVPEYSDKTYSAEVHLIGKSIDQDRTVQVHAHLDEENQERELADHRITDEGEALLRLDDVDPGPLGAHGLVALAAVIYIPSLSLWLPQLLN